MTLKIVYRPRAKLIPYARNARTHNEAQVAQIAGSIREFGWTNPVLVDPEDGIIAGHGRVLAAELLEIDKVPCIVLSGLTEAQKRAYVLADNKLALNAGWDEELLKLELGDLRAAGYDLDFTGFAPGEIASLSLDGEGVGGLTDDDDAPPPERKKHSAAGDVWVCGEHRVICGDSCVPETYVALMDGTPADAIWTDPPYNIDYQGGTKEKLKIANDSMSPEAFAAFLQGAFGAMATAVRAGGAIYVAHSDKETPAFRAAMVGAGFKLSGCLIWVKDALVLGRSDYQWRHEPILYGWREGAAHRWYGGRRKTTVREADELPFTDMGDGRFQIDLGSSTLVISGKDLEVEEVRSDILRAEKPKRSLEHPTMKPVALVEDMVLNSTRRGDVVLDPFGGSGTTMIVCERLGRRARLVDLDPRFADVIVKRWQNFTGRVAVHAQTGKPFPVGPASTDE